MMKVGFSTLGCPAWSLAKAIAEAKRIGFQGVELRWVANSDALWEVPGLTAGDLPTSKRMFADAGIICSDIGARPHFHFPDEAKRKEQIEEAKRCIDIAAGLNAPGVRLWGDKIQKGADRASTMKWISESIWTLAEYARPSGVELWLESHGDFTASADVAALLNGCGCHGVGAAWDPANAFVAGEDPMKGAPILAPYIKHVHIKDQKNLGAGKRQLLPMGEGEIPLAKIVEALAKMNYKGFLSYEWEKKNVSALAEPEVAFPAFIAWWNANGK